MVDIYSPILYLIACSTAVFERFWVELTTLHGLIEQVKSNPDWFKTCRQKHYKIVLSYPINGRV